ncbi:tRNA1(Val) (adenine(37)-N6)-methyltransferase [Alkalihalobacillus sp. LMS39]|uniref:tRNA1(Val) (adenine(37)-N6)-methyltransferase n=1 Tax=Alkalihalobacillus sp. LMS39 TaxID=2924032 RepID=UPI001FB1F269|nr:tRNA1(Val) (adenine(37)-N6)-methyltransferase [Alkalihalobacillus sp. LMS39]UOE94175.1 tRNA1(Val) (adenine(37)-N6)-methyltransferase [Alkalihalobacillus sp. LMS39]
MERVDYLPYGKLKIVQSSNVFSFSMDAVLLARFVSVPIQKGKMIDLCTGNAVIPLLLSERSKASIIGVEIQETLFNMAIQSVHLNKLEHQINILHADIKELPQDIKGGEYDVVTCNPPYFEVNNETDYNQNKHFAIARHELFCTLEDVIQESSRLVKQKGKVALVHRPERLGEIITVMKSNRIEPKRIQFVHPKNDKDANIVLVEGIKDGQKGIKCEPPIFVYDSNQQYTEQFKQWYGIKASEKEGE